MRGIKMYQPNGAEAPIDTLSKQSDPKLTRKILLQIFRLASLHPAEMREPLSSISFWSDTAPCTN
jgi:hypothetical protein